MNNSRQPHTDDMPPAAPDWHVIAEARLAKLVELEHECSVARGQLSTLQAERHEWEARHAEELRAGLTQRHALIKELEQHEVELAQLDAAMARGEDARQETERECANLRSELAASAQRLQAMQASFLSSTSWRITAPLRAISVLLGRGRAR